MSLSRRKLNPLQTGERYAFVSMGFVNHSDYDPVFQAVRRACEKARMAAVRADDLRHHALITQVVNAMIDEASVVVADLSSRRPNVYHEIGYCHGRKKPLVVVAYRGTPLSWVISHYPILEFSDENELELRLLDRLEVEISTLPQHDEEAFARWGASYSQREPVELRMATTEEELLKGLNLRKLPPLDSGRTLGEIGDGVRGFANPYEVKRILDLIHTFGDREPDQWSSASPAAITLQSNPGGTFELPLCVLSGRRLAVILTMQPHVARQFAQAPKGAKHLATGALKLSETFSELVLLPLQMVESWRQRDTPLGSILDVVLKRLPGLE